VPNGKESAQAFQGRFVEDLRHQAHIFVDKDLAAITDRDAGRFLTTVLERIEAEVGQLGDFFARCPYAKDPARVLGAFFTGKKVMREQTITSCHIYECRHQRQQLKPVA
jgi:hypothetical protein